MLPTRCFALGLVLSFTSLARVPCEDSPKTPARDLYAQGMSALRRNDFEEAIRLLGSLPPDHPRFTDAMDIVGLTICARHLDNPERGLPYVEQAYLQAPENMEVVKAYIDVLVQSGKAFPTQRPERAHAKEAKPEFQFLTRSFKSLDDSPRVPRAKIEEDLDYLELRLQYCYSYLERRGIDYQGALDAIRLSLSDENGLPELVLKLSMLLCLFGDAHSRLAVGIGAVLPRGYAPFQAASYDGRVVAFTTDRKSFVDAEHPFLRKIDGLAIEKWLDAAGRIVPQGSAQLTAKGRIDALIFLRFLREELGLPAKEKAQLELESEDRSRTKIVALLIEAKPGERVKAVRRDTGRIGELGYLRIPKMDMDPKFLEALDTSMADLKATKGLIIDVRDNSGGTQDALKALLPYFLKSDDPLQIVNVAAYRMPVDLPRPNPSGFLGLYGRSLHPVTSAVWKPDEAELIRKFLAGFKPSWPLPAGKFSDWHVMAIDPKSNPKAYRYDRPVCVLSNAGSYSATDNFLGAFKGRPNVTIVGTPSGGGSGRMQDYKLPNSRLQLTLCQMASYSRTGQLYDGQGVQPDVLVEPRPEDQIGKGDAVLDAALKLLGEKLEKREK